MKWISVKDELPRDFQEVLFFALTNGGNTREIMTGHRENGFWKHCCMFYSSQTLNHLVKVTHWMELPDYPNLDYTPKNEMEVGEVIIDDPLCPKPGEKLELDERTKKFAVKFIDENIDLLKRLADR